MNIYVGNLSRKVTEETLRSEFEQFGEVASVKIIKDKFSGEPRGFAFVEMPNNDEAQAAMENLNNKDVDGQKMRINEARPQEDRFNRAPRPGGNRFGGGPRTGGDRFGGPRSGGDRFGSDRGGKNNGWRS